MLDGTEWSAGADADAEELEGLSAGLLPAYVEHMRRRYEQGGMESVYDYLRVRLGWREGCRAASVAWNGVVTWEWIEPQDIRDAAVQSRLSRHLDEINQRKPTEFERIQMQRDAEYRRFIRDAGGMRRGRTARIRAYERRLKKAAQRRSEK